MSITPATHDFEVIRGTDFGPHTITCRDVAGVVVDLTGWTAYAEVRRTRNRSGTPYLDLAPVITTGTDGVITFPAITAADTAEMLTGNRGWSLILKNASGIRKGPYVVGGFNVVDDYTHL